MKALVALGLSAALVLLTARHAAADDAPGAAKVPKYEGASAATWAERLQSKDLETRRKAIYALALLKEASAVAAEQLAACLGDSDTYVADTAWHALEKLGPRAGAAVPRLAEMLRSREPETRVRVALVLPKVGRKDSAALAALQTALEDQDARALIYITSGVGRFGPDAAGAVPKLVAHLEKGTSEDVRRESAIALIRIGPGASASAVPALERLTKEPDSPPAFVYALACLSEGSRQQLVDRVVAAALGEDPQASNSASWAMLDAGPDTPPVVSEAIVKGLVPALASDAPAVRTRALNALRNLGPVAKAALPAVEKMEKDSDAGVRLAATVALSRIRS